MVHVRRRGHAVGMRRDPVGVGVRRSVRIRLRGPVHVVQRAIGGRLRGGAVLTGRFRDNRRRAVLRLFGSAAARVLAPVLQQGKKGHALQHQDEDQQDRRRHAAERLHQRHGRERAVLGQQHVAQGAEHRQEQPDRHQRGHHLARHAVVVQHEHVHVAEHRNQQPEPEEGVVQEPRRRIQHVEWKRRRCGPARRQERYQRGEGERAGGRQRQRARLLKALAGKPPAPGPPGEIHHAVTAAGLGHGAAAARCGRVPIPRVSARQHPSRAPAEPQPSFGRATARSGRRCPPVPGTGRTGAGGRGAQCATAG